MDLETRIAQFEQLCQDDPSNDMAWFSLGGAYAQAERHADAAEAYRKCVAANVNMSKAYQLAGKSLIALGQSDEAGEILEKGYAVAAERGDVMPKQAIAELLGEIGRAVPEIKAEKAETPAAPPGSFVDRKTGKPGTKMAYAPFKGGVGAWIHKNISKETFDEWIGLGTKIINELKLDLSKDEHEAVYDYGMRRFIGLSDEIYLEASGGKSPPEPPAEYKSTLDTILGRMGELEEFQGNLDQQVSS
ncbi:MAG: Fe(2+)-trafficking protein [Planctomycetota bacterium]